MAAKLEINDAVLYCKEGQPSFVFTRVVSLDEIGDPLLYHMSGERKGRYTWLCDRGGENQIKSTDEKRYPRYFQRIGKYRRVLGCLWWKLEVD